MINTRISSSPLILTTLLLCLMSSSLWAQTYRILLSNDDGIESPLLEALQQELAALPNVEVVVSAPHENQSGSSHSSGSTTFAVDRISRNGVFFGYAVHGKPADAVRFGIIHLGAEDPFDLVVSGINRGANVGNVSHLSGTVGAAMEAVFQGLPAIAISQEIENVDTSKSAKFGAQMVKHYQETGAPEGVVVSINIPGGELKGVAVRPMGDSYLKYTGYDLVAEEGSQSTYERIRIREQSDDTGSDTYAFQQGYISITPLKFDWTENSLISEIESWDMRLID